MGVTTALLIPAAGASRRFGVAKQLLEREGETLIRRAVRTGKAAGLDPVVVVIGHDPDGRIRSAIDGLEVLVAENLQWKDGVGRSIGCGVRLLLASRRPVESLIVALPDQPLVTSSDLRRLVETHESSGAPLVAAAYAGTFGVPALFTRGYFDALLRLEGDRGARSILAGSTSQLVTVPMEHAALDIDAPGDWERLAGSDPPPCNARSI
jgi:molybdenum cofactor cytidylyltransferase